MNDRCLRLLGEFCARHTLPVPEPDEQGRYQLGCDQVEVIIFEDLGSLYLLAQLTAVPEKPDECAGMIEKACGYLFNYLYLDECILNVYNIEGVDYLILATSMAEPDPNNPEEFENQFSALVNRAEALVSHFDETQRAKPENRFSIFRP